MFLCSFFILLNISLYGPKCYWHQIKPCDCSHIYIWAISIFWWIIIFETQVLVVIFCLFVFSFFLSFFYFLFHYLGSQTFSVSRLFLAEADCLNFEIMDIILHSVSHYLILLGIFCKYIIQYVNISEGQCRCVCNVSSLLGHFHTEHENFPLISQLNSPGTDSKSSQPPWYCCNSQL